MSAYVVLICHSEGFFFFWDFFPNVQKPLVGRERGRSSEGVGEAVWHRGFQKRVGRDASGGRAGTESRHTKLCLDGQERRKGEGGHSLITVFWNPQEMVTGV